MTGYIVNSLQKHITETEYGHLNKWSFWPRSRSYTVYKMYIFLCLLVKLGSIDCCCTTFLYQSYFHLHVKTFCYLLDLTFKIYVDGTALKEVAQWFNNHHNFTVHRFLSLRYINLDLYKSVKNNDQICYQKYILYFEVIPYHVCIYLQVCYSLIIFMGRKGNMRNKNIKGTMFSLA